MVIDIHSHILPGLDDGPANLDAAVAMAGEAVRAGVHAIVATPHAFSPFFDVAPDARDTALTLLTRALKSNGIPLQLLSGFECFAVENFTERLKTDARYFMPGFAGSKTNRHVLVELGKENPVECLGGLLYDCQLQDITPILAHPERCPEVMQNPGLIEPFVRKGGKLQISTGSIVGIREKRLRRACQFLLKNNLVSYVASDAHSQHDYALWGKAMKRVGKIMGIPAPTNCSHGEKSP